MKQPLFAGRACSVLAILAGCATQPAPGISGRWMPVNHFDAAPQAIPLHPAYEFYASPLDRTLKSMLSRWALDTRMTLAYEDASDFTLYEPVTRVRSTDLHAAIAALASLYAREQLTITVENNSIAVRPAPVPASAPAPAASMSTQLPATGAMAGRP